MLLAFDSGLNVRDFYFPYVGLYNHLSGAKLRMGVWVEDRFAWLEDPSWSKAIDYMDGTLASNVLCRNEELELELHLVDVVHHGHNLYIKRIEAKNLANRPREARIFFSHDLRIMESDIGDTAFFNPYLNAIVHYKLDNYFLISGYDAYGGISQYTTGVKGYSHLVGTWRDAEDGQLAGNPIEQGSVDSTVAFHLPLPAEGAQTMWYWIACGRNLQQVSDLHQLVQARGPEALARETENFWRAWVSKSAENFSKLPQRIADFCARSLLIMRTQIDDRGAVTAANDSDIMQNVKAHYSYLWPRDGAIITSVFDELRFALVSRNFFKFCARVLPPDRAALMHKYTPDGSMGASWHPWYIDGKAEVPFQEDGTGLVMWALWRHYESLQDIEFVEPLYEKMIVPMCDFMVDFRDPHSHLPLPSWDLWEERRGVHCFTTVAVWAGLEAGARFAELIGDTRAKKFKTAANQIKENFKTYFYDHDRGFFLRTLYPSKRGGYSPDLVPDSSSLVIPLFGMFPIDDPEVESSARTIEQRLWVNTEVGGMARYENDYYFRQSHSVPGNPWFICTLWLAEHLILAADEPCDMERPLELLEWCIRWALPTGALSEQIHPYTGEPLSVAPLTWSHAAFVHTALQYSQKMERLNGRGRRKEDQRGQTPNKDKAAR